VEPVAAGERRHRLPLKQPLAADAAIPGGGGQRLAREAVHGGGRGDPPRAGALSSAPGGAAGGALPRKAVDAPPLLLPLGIPECHACGPLGLRTSRDPSSGPGALYVLDGAVVEVAEVGEAADEAPAVVLEARERVSLQVEDAQLAQAAERLDNTLALKPVPLQVEHLQRRAADRDLEHDARVPLPHVRRAL